MNLRIYSFWTVAYFGVFVGLLSLISSCGGTSSSSLTSSTTIKSSNLSVSVSALTLGGSTDSKGLVVKSAVTGLNEATTPCPTGTTTCYSPSAMGGKFSGFTLRISTNGTYQRLEIVPPVQGTDDDGDEIISTNLNSFDLGSPSAISGSPSVNTGSLNDSSHFSDLIWTVGWIDAKFAANTFDAVGEATLRFVYFTDTATGYQKGDVLIKDGSSFKWCPTGTTLISQCQTTRPSSPITQNSGIVNHTPASGDPELPYLAAEISANAGGTEEVTVSASQLSGTVNFTADFDHANAFAIEDTTPGPFSNIFEVMPLLYIRGLSATPSGISVTGGIGAVLTVSQ